MAFQTEIEFTLPRGYLDTDGTLHREGVMRLATAADEILPQKDPRVQANTAYLTIIVLSRVVTKLGSLPDVNPRIIENLYTADVSYLQSLYERMNGDGSGPKIVCPKCEHEFDPGGNGLGSLKGYPLALLYEEMAFIAYHFHWPQEELMNMEHQQRRRWCEEISRINHKLSDEPENIFDLGESNAS